MERNPGAWARLEAARDPRAVVAARTPEALRGNAASHAGRVPPPEQQVAKPLTAHACTMRAHLDTGHIRGTTRSYVRRGHLPTYGSPLTTDEVAALRTASADPDELVRLAVALTESGASQEAIAAAAGVNTKRLSSSVRQARNRET
ncbi:hypothetical protein [Embleya sp. NPDC020630]|uniref:hypothetical protein n=1 Tax=Embleya sp. NPDC020630 TaxID=3363979 RepID=UPI00378C3C05